MDHGRPPPDLAEEQNSLNSILPAFFTNNVDRSGLDLNFGDCTLQPKDIVDKGDMVRVRYLLTYNFCCNFKSIHYSIARCSKLQYIERILNKIVNTFNKSFAG